MFCVMQFNIQLPPHGYESKPRTQKKNKQNQTKLDHVTCQIPMMTTMMTVHCYAYETKSKLDQQMTMWE